MTPIAFAHICTNCKVPNATLLFCLDCWRAVLLSILTTLLGVIGARIVSQGIDATEGLIYGAVIIGFLCGAVVGMLLGQADSK